MTRIGARWRLVVACVLVVGVGAGCSSPDDKLPTVADVSTTTNPDDRVDMETPPPPMPADQIVAALDKAVAASDVCALLAAMDAASPTTAGAAGTIDVYKALAAATKAAQAFVPKELRIDWQQIVLSTKEGADAVTKARGDLDDPEVQAAFSSQEVVSAGDDVERYQRTNCPAPAPSA
ncbi:MAG: hypothetical protein U0Q22_16925 [Acidimicrobiales bacterium]